MLHPTRHLCAIDHPTSHVVHVDNIKLETNPKSSITKKGNDSISECSSESVSNSLMLKPDLKQEIKIESTNTIKFDKPDAVDEHEQHKCNNVQNVSNEELALFDEHISVHQTISLEDKKPAETTSSLDQRTVAVPTLDISSPSLPSDSLEVDPPLNAAITDEGALSQIVNKVNGTVPASKNISSNFGEVSFSACSNVSKQRSWSGYPEKSFPCTRLTSGTAPVLQPALDESRDLRNVLNAARKRKLQAKEHPLNAELQRILKVKVIPGKCCNEMTYSRTLLLADKNFQPLSKIWSWTSEVIPDLIIKEDLKITDVEPIVNALINVSSKDNSKRMLVIVALRLNEGWTFTSFKDCNDLCQESLQCISLLKNKITLNVFTDLQKQFEGKVDLLFAHVIPSGWHLIQRSLIALHAVLEGHKVFSTKLTGHTLMQTKSFVHKCASVNSFLVENGLSSINGLPCWNLLKWETTVIENRNCYLSNLPVQNNGKDLTCSALQTIALKVCELSLQYQAQSTWAIPTLVSSVTTNLSWQPESESRTFTKLVLIADAKLSLLEKKWPKEFHLQPEIEIIGVLKPSELLKKLLATYDQSNDTLFIVCPSVRNLLLVKQVKDCNDHNVLKYPSCRAGVGPHGSLPNTVFKKIQELKRCILERFKRSCVAISTVHCIKFQMIMDNLCRKHEKETGHVVTELIDESFTEQQTRTFQAGINCLNELICKENKCNGLPDFDIFNFIDVDNSSCLSNYIPDGMNLSDEAINILANKCMENLMNFNSNDVKKMDDTVPCNENGSRKTPLLSVINSVPRTQILQLDRNNHASQVNSVEVANLVHPQSSKLCDKNILVLPSNSRGCSDSINEDNSTIDKSTSRPITRDVITNQTDLSDVSEEMFDAGNIKEAPSPKLSAVVSLQPSIESHHVLNTFEVHQKASNQPSKSTSQLPTSETSVDYRQQSSSSKYTSTHLPFATNCKRVLKNRPHSAEYRSRTRKYRSRSPDYRSRSPDYRSRSPDYRSRSPDYRSHSSKYRSRSSKYIPSPKDNQHAPNSSQLLAHDRATSNGVSKDVLNSLNGGSWSPISSISLNDSFPNSQIFRRNQFCSSKLKKTGMDNFSRSDDPIADQMYLKKRMKVNHRSSTTLLDGKSNSSKNRRNSFKRSSPVESRTSKFLVDSTAIDRNCSGMKEEDKSPFDVSSRSCTHKRTDHSRSYDVPKNVVLSKKTSPTVPVTMPMLEVQLPHIKAHGSVLQSSPELGSSTCTKTASSIGSSKGLSQHSDRPTKKSSEYKKRSSKHRDLSTLSKPTCHTRAGRPSGVLFSANKLIKDELRSNAQETAHLETIALATLRSFHDQYCEKYLKDPSTHPAYQDERLLFIERCLSSTRSSTSDVEDFLASWKIKLVNMLEETWNQRKERCLTMLRNLQSYCCPPTRSKLRKQQCIDAVNHEKNNLDLLKALRKKRKLKSKERLKLVEQLSEGNKNCKESQELLKQLKFSNDVLVKIILEETLLMTGYEDSNLLESDPCDVITTLRILSVMTETFESLSISLSMMLQSLLKQQDKLNLFLFSFSRCDKTFLKMALCKLKEEKENNLEDVQKVIICEAYDRLEALLFRLLDYSDPFFGLNINTDFDADEFEKIVKVVCCETKDLLKDTSLSSIVILVVSMAVRSALTEKSSILSKDETDILLSHHDKLELEISQLTS